MESLLLNVGIGLVLIYAAMAALLMKLQESLHGGMRRGRVQNMHKLMLEAVGGDEDLKTRVLASPLLFSLYSGNEIPREGHYLRRPTGPSAMPGDLFAKALLMTLNPSGKLPSSETLAPMAFMDKLLKDEKLDTARGEYLNGLRALVPARDSGWPEFETAIATWFADIGDRADGWYKRRSSVTGLVMAVVLCAALNVDTGNIINTLGGDSELRQGLGNLADLVLKQRAGEDKAGSTPAAPADPLQDPATRAIARLVDATAYVSEAYYKDKAITKFGYYVTEMKVCPNEVHPTPFGKDKGEGKFVSNSDTWVSILPALLPLLEQGVNHVENSDVQADLNKVYLCLLNVSAWVRAASTASDSPDTRRVMVEAAKALEDSKSGVLAILRSDQQQGGLRRLFRLDPDTFRQCVEDPKVTAASMQACVMREQDLMGRLPLLHTGANWRQQFCKIEPLKDEPQRQAALQLPAQLTLSAPSASQVLISIDPVQTASSAATRPTDRSSSWWSRQICSEYQQRPNPRLDVPGMRLDFQPLNTLTWSIGVLISALFVSLGAPILFDTLKRWVNLRNAGQVRDATKSGLTGGGTLPLPMLAGGGASAGLSGGGAGNASASSLADAGIGTLPAVEGAAAGFEEQLTPREVQAVKQRLGVQPSTGGFDEETRAKIREFTPGSSQLTPASYLQLMGRAPVQARQLVGPVPPSGQALLRQPYDLAPILAAKLDAKLQFPNRVPITETTYSDELRAMAVLFRFKSGSDQSEQAEVFRVTDAHPEQLDQLDPVARDKILTSDSTLLPRFPNAPWIDVALGELGQVERDGSTRATSNPRVCEYLDAIGSRLGDSGDHTAWCGAFVTWVLKHPHANATPGTPAAPAIAPGFVSSNGFSIADSLPERALSWRRWPRPGVSPATIAGPAGAPLPERGDVVVVANGEGGHHVGFVFKVNALSGEFWMLGGNQRNGTRVSLSRWRLSSII